MPREANFPFSCDFEDDEPELMQCDCCGEMKPIDDIDFIPSGARGNSAGCDTYQCQECYEKAKNRAMGVPTEAEIAASQANIAAVLGPEEIAKLDAESLPLELLQCEYCRKDFPQDALHERHGILICERCLEEAEQENWKYRP